jgi:hypothetical protein
MPISDNVALQRLGRPLCLARLLGRDFVAHSALQGFSIETWSPAPRGCSVGSWLPTLPCKVAGQGLGRPLYLARLLDRDFLGFVWAPHSWVSQHLYYVASLLSILQEFLKLEPLYVTMCTPFSVSIIFKTSLISYYINIHMSGQ